METSVLIAVALILGWVVVAVVVAMIIARGADAGEHESRMETLRRDIKNHVSDKTHR